MRRPLTRVLAAGALAIAAAAPAFAAGVGERAPGLHLPDQFGREHTLRFPADRPSVLVLADRRGSEHLDPWVRSFFERYGDRVFIRGVALLAGVPRWVRPTVRALFRRQLSEPICLDWEGAASAAYAYAPGVPLVVVVGSEGRIAWRASGPATEEALAAGFRHLDALLTGAATPGAP